jgi:hypothetical protein
MDINSPYIDLIIVEAITNELKWDEISDMVFKKCNFRPTIPDKFYTM